MSKRWPTSLDRAEREVLPLGLSLYHAARDYQGGIKAVAAVHGLNATTLQHKLSPTHEPHRPNLDDLEAVLAVTRDPRILDSLGEIAGGCVWVQPESLRDDEPMDSVLATIADLHAKLGEMIESVGTSLDDGLVDDREQAELRLRTRRVLELVLGLERLTCGVGEGEA